MSDAFVGEIRMFCGNYNPLYWAFCDGQQVAISQNQILFSLLGTTYGGDGRSTFMLPDFRDRTPMHAGTGPGLTPRPLGARGGASQVRLQDYNLPPHSHAAVAYDASATDAVPSGVTRLAQGYDPTISREKKRPKSLYNDYDPTKKADLNVQTVGTTGGGLPHNNRQPYLGINFIICLDGYYPNRN